jgi:hypothetical protein
MPRRTIQNLAQARVPLHWLESKRGGNCGQSRSGNSCTKSRDQTTGTGTDAVTQCDHRLARYQQQRSEDHSKALRSDDVSIGATKDRGGSKGKVGEGESATKEGVKHRSTNTIASENWTSFYGHRTIGQKNPRLVADSAADEANLTDDWRSVRHSNGQFISVESCASLAISPHERYLIGIRACF